MPDYEPELGQMAFGNAWGRYDVSALGDAAVAHVLAELDRVWWNIHQAEREQYTECTVGGVTYRAYYWGDCTCGHDQAAEEWHVCHPHRPDCYQSDLRRWRAGEGAGLSFTPAEHSFQETLCEKHGIPWNDGFACAIHCTCGQDQAWTAWLNANDHAPTCPIVLPNLQLAGSGVEIRWYKYPGRGMTVNREMSPADWHDWLNACIAALREAEPADDFEPQQEGG